MFDFAGKEWLMDLDTQIPWRLTDTGVPWTTPSLPPLTIRFIASGKKVFFCQKKKNMKNILFNGRFKNKVDLSIVVNVH